MISKTEEDFALAFKKNRQVKGTYNGMCGGVLAIEYATDTWFLEQDEWQDDYDSINVPSLERIP
jgi:hypothetical protein